MENKRLVPDEFMRILEAMPDADHKAIGSLAVHTGTHPIMGEVTIVSSSSQDAVLICSSTDL